MSPPGAGEWEERLLDISEFWEGIVRGTGSARQEVVATEPAMEEDLTMHWQQWGCSGNVCGRHR